MTTTFILEMNDVSRVDEISWLELPTFDLSLELVKFDPSANAPEHDSGAEAPEFLYDSSAPQVCK